MTGGARREATPVGRIAKSAAASAAVVFAVILVGRVSGMARDLVVAPLLGAGADVDALVAARTLPEIVIYALASGLVVALVPALAQLAGPDGKLDHDGRRAFSVVASWIVLVLVGITLLGAAFPGPILTVLAPGLEAYRLALAAHLLRVMMPVVLFSTSAAILAALMQYGGRFGVPSARVAVINITIICSVIVGWRTLGVKSVAIGWTLGAVLQLGILVPFAWRELRGLVPSLSLRAPGVLTTVLLVVPICFSNLLLFGRYVLERQFGSFLAAGALSHLNYALRIASAPMLIVANAIGTVYLTVLARYWAKGDHSKAIGALRDSIRLFLFAVMPFVAAFLVGAEPTVSLLLQRGVFTATDSAATGKLLEMYVLMMVGGGLTIVLAQFFFAIRRTAAPNIAVVLGLVVQTALTVATIRHGGAEAVALGTGIGTIVTAASLLVGVGLTMGWRALTRLPRDLFEFLIAGAAMYVVLVLLWRITSSELPTVGEGVRLLICLAVASSVYLAATLVLGGRELRALGAMIRGRTG